MNTQNIIEKTRLTTKTKAAIALLLMLSMAISMLALPLATAHTPPLNIPTYAFLAVTPNPTGVNQEVLVTMWLDKVPPTANTAYGDRWQNMTVTVQSPDGTSKTLGPFTSSDVGAYTFAYTPTQTGSYSFQFFFAGQTLANANPPPPSMMMGPPSAYIGDYYEPSQSSIVTLTVQQNQIQPYPQTAVPLTNYWQFPINGMNSNWRYISGDWLTAGYDSMGSYNNPYTTAPNTAHILWTYPVAFGGVNGNPTAPDWNYYTGLAYQAKFNSPLIMYGNLIFNTPISENAGAGGAESINLRTGKVNWHINASIAYGEEFDYATPNQFGVIPYLWSTGSFAMFSMSAPTWTAYDPMTGDQLFQINDVQMGGFSFGGPTTVFGPNGELLDYVLDPGYTGTGNHWLAMWNSTQCIGHYSTINANNVWEWRPSEGITTFDWMYGVQWNVTLSNAYIDSNGIDLVIQRVTPDYILATSGSIATPQNWEWEVGYSATTGQQLWATNRTTPGGSTTWALIGPSTADVYTEFHESTETWYAYSLATGNQLWGPTTPYGTAFGMYSWQASIANGLLLAEDFGGYIRAFNMTNGQSAWNFYTGNSGITTAYGSWPPNNPPPITADGKVYFVTGHAYNPPLFPGAQVYCLNETTGNLIWSELGFYTYNPALVADGDLVAYNSYDAQVYCYGPGLSATTVSGPTLAVTQGSPVLLQGTVTDQSPGNTCLGKPAAGTPAISDASMSAWMAYLYMQQTKPTNATGVTVHLTAIDPNGNSQDIGYATSDDHGLYSISWVPPVPGVYTVTATFAGTNSYYSSDAQTSFLVSAAPSAAVVATAAAPTAVPTQPPTSVTPTLAPTATIAATPSPVVIPPASGVPTATYVAIGLAIVIIVAIAAALVLRRRK